MPSHFSEPGHIRIFSLAFDFVRGELPELVIQGGLALIQRTEGPGFSSNDVMLTSARFLLLAGFPKRVEGICDKMIEEYIPAVEIYPLLIRAYREPGRDDDARDAESLYNQALTREG